MKRLLLLALVLLALVPAYAGVPLYQVDYVAQDSLNEFVYGEVTLFATDVETGKHLLEVERGSEKLVIEGLADKESVTMVGFAKSSQTLNEPVSSLVFLQTGEFDSAVVTLEATEQLPLVKCDALVSGTRICNKWSEITTLLEVGDGIVRFTVYEPGVYALGNPSRPSRPSEFQQKVSQQNPGMLLQINEQAKLDLQPRSRVSVTDVVTDVSSGKSYVRVERGLSSIEINNAEIQIIEGINIVPASSEIVTEIAIVNGAESASGTLRLAKTTGQSISGIARCEEITLDGECTSGWQQTNILFNDFGSYVEFSVEGFSGYGGKGEPGDITIQSVAATNFTANGTWEVTTPLAWVYIETVGGGGGGGGSSSSGSGGSGGAGGQYAAKTILGVGSGNYTIVVGSGGTAGAAAGGTGGTGTNSSFNGTTLRAMGGAGGAGNAGTAGTGSTTNGIGDTVYAGGNGGTGGASGGGGGGGAGSTGSGGNASAATQGTGTSQLGGDGGAGSLNAAGLPGNNYGGAGGGGERSGGTSYAGAAGAAGIVRITYQNPGTPAISNVENNSITPSSATITWDTDIYANSTIRYGTTTALSSGIGNSSSTYSTSRSLILNGLNDGTTYYYNVTSCDAANNCNTTGPYSFATLSYGYLDVTLTYPPNETQFSANETFTINATVTCEGAAGAVCGIIAATPRLNTTDASADTILNTTTSLQLSSIQEIINTTDDLSATDTGDWMGTNLVGTLSTGSNSDLVYLRTINGDFGVYNRTANITYDLSATDTGNWIGTDHVYSIAVDPINGDFVYLGVSGGKFGVYNRTANITYDLSATDTGNWIGIDSIYAVAVDPNNGLMYVGTSGGKFGVYNRTANITYDLSATDTGNWIGTTSITDLAVNPNNELVYMVLQSGKFGVYNRTANITYDLSATDTGDWIGITHLQAVAVDPNSDLVYVLGQIGIFGVYNRTSNTTEDLRATDPSDWIGASTSNSVAVDPNSELAYLGIASGKFGVYNRTANITYDLSATDTGDWIGTSTIQDIAVDPNNSDVVYLGVSSGKFGVYQLYEFQDEVKYSTSLSQGESYDFSFKVLHPGAEGVSYYVDMNFSSVTYSDDITENETADIKVCIGECEGEDTTPPVISARVNSSTTTTFTVDWTTDENANSSVTWGTTTALSGGSNNSDSLTTSHSRTIYGLDDNTLYYYNITSCDASGNCETEGPHNVTTEDDGVDADTCTPTTGNHLIITSPLTCNAPNILVGDLNISSQLTIVGGTLIANKTTITTTGAFYAANSSSTIWQNDNLTIAGNYTLDNSTLRMNATADQGIGIYLQPTGIMTIANRSVVTTGAVSYLYNWQANGTLNVTNSFLNNSYEIAGRGNETITDSEVNSTYAGLASYSGKLTLLRTNVSVTTAATATDLRGTNDLVQNARVSCTGSQTCIYIYGPTNLTFIDSYTSGKIEPALASGTIGNWSNNTHVQTAASLQAFRISQINNWLFTNGTINITNVNSDAVSLYSTSATGLRFDNFNMIGVGASFWQGSGKQNNHTLSNLNINLTNGREVIDYTLSAGSENITIENATIRHHSSSTYNLLTFAYSKKLILNNITVYPNTTTVTAFRIVHTNNATLTNITVYNNPANDLVIQNSSITIKDFNIRKYNFTSNVNVTFANSENGSIELLTPTNASGTNLSQEVQFGESWAYFNESNSQLNKTANITLLNVPVYDGSAIYRDGVDCSADCTNQTGLSGTVVFNVSKAGNYSIVEISTGVSTDTCTPTAGNHLLITIPLVCNNPTIVVNDLNISSSLTIIGGSIIANKTTITTTGAFYASNSSGTIWQNDNLTIAGNYTLDNSTLRINGTNDGEIGIRINSTGLMLLENGSLVTNGAASAFNYFFIVPGALNASYSTINASGVNTFVSNSYSGVYVTGSVHLYYTNISAYLSSQGDRGLIINTANASVRNSRVIGRCVGIKLMDGANASVEIIDSYSAETGTCSAGVENDAGSGTFRNTTIVGVGTSRSMYFISASNNGYYATNITYQAGITFTASSNYVLENSTIRLGSTSSGTTRLTSSTNLTLRNITIQPTGSALLNGINWAAGYSINLDNVSVTNPTTAFNGGGTNVIINRFSVTSNVNTGTILNTTFNNMLVENSSWLLSGANAIATRILSSNNITFNNITLNLTGTNGIGFSFYNSTNLTLQEVTVISNSSGVQLNSTNSTINLIDTAIGAYAFASSDINLSINSSTYGKIIFLQKVGGSDTNLSSDIQIGQNWAYINESKSGLNKTANITLINVPVYIMPVIYRDSVECTTICTVQTGLSGTVVFNVSKAGNYSVVETAVNASLTSVTLNATDHPSNTTAANLTAHPIGASDYDTLIYDWRKEGTSIAVLNMPFDTNISTNDTGAVKDYSLFLNNASLANSSSKPTWISNGISGGAYDFDGLNDYITVNSLNNFTPGNITISMWINWKGAGAESQPDGRQALLNARNPDDDIWFTINLSSPENRLNVYFGDLANPGYYNGSSDILMNSWTHVATTYNGSEVVIYVNGSQDASFSTTGSIAVDASTFNIGARETFAHGDDFYFNGSIDEVLILDSALTAEQIEAIYNSGTPKYDLIVSEETNVGENWSVVITPNNYTLGDGTSQTSNTVQIEELEYTVYNTCSPYYWQNLVINVSTVCEGITLRAQNLTIESDFTFIEGTLNVHNTYVNASGRFFAYNSSSTIWQNGDLDIYGNYTIDNSTLRINGTTNGGIGIFVNGSGNMVLDNSSTVTNGEDAAFRYDFLVNGTLTSTQSTINASGWTNTDNQRGLTIYGDATLDSTTITNGYSGIDNRGTFTFNDGEISSTTVAIRVASPASTSSVDNSNISGTQRSFNLFTGGPTSVTNSNLGNTYYVDSGGTGTFSNNTITVTSGATNDAGISFIWGTGTIENSTINVSYASGRGIDLQPSSTGTARFRNITIFGPGAGIRISGLGGDDHTFDNFTINTTGTPITATAGIRTNFTNANIITTNATIASIATTGINLENITIIPEAHNYTALSLSTAINTTINNVSIITALPPRYFADISTSSGTTIANSTLRHTGSQSNNNNGIRIQASNNTLINNTHVNVTGYGAYLGNTNRDTTISASTLQGGSNTIYLNGGHYRTTINRSMLAYNGGGVNLLFSGGGTIYNTSIIDTTIQRGSIGLDIINTDVSGFWINRTNITSATNGVRIRTASANAIAEDSELYTIYLADGQSSADTTNLELINTTYTSYDQTGCDGTPNCNLTIRWYVDAYVNDSSGSPINAADVNATNVDTLSLFTETTSASGTITPQLITEKEVINTVENTFQNTTVVVGKTGYDINTTTVNVTSTRTLNFTLYASSSNLISSCPFTLDTANTIYYLTQNITSTSNCITIGAHNVTLEGQGYEIRGNNTGAAINNPSGYDNITLTNMSIHNFTLGVNASGMTDSVMTKITLTAPNITDTRGIYYTAGARNNITHSSFTTYGQNGYGVYAHSSNTNRIEFNNLTTQGSSAHAIYSQSNTLTYYINNTANASGSSAAGIRTASSSSDKIVNNTASVYGSNGYAAYIESTGSNNSIENNTLVAYGNSGIGLQTIWTASSNFTGNTIESYGQSGTGISISLSGGNRIINNSILVYHASAAGYGVNIFDSNSNIVDGNAINVTNGYGYATGGTSTSNRLYNNVIYVSGSNYYGIISNTLVAENNTIITSGFQAHGVFQGSSNRFIDNNITASGTNSNAYRLDWLTNTVVTGGIATSINSHAIHLSNSNTRYVNITNVTINNTNASNYDIYWGAAGINEVVLTDMNVGNYFFTGAGGRISINNSHGKVDFNSNVSGTGTNLSAIVVITNNSAYINESVTLFNVSSNITLRNILTNHSWPGILRNSIICPESICTNLTSLNLSTVQFNTSKAGTYSIVDELPLSTPIVIEFYDNTTILNKAYNNSNITLSVNWTLDAKPDLESAAYFCNSSSITSSGCADTEYCSTELSVNKFQTCEFTAIDLNAVEDYWVAVCTSHNNCSIVTGPDQFYFAVPGDPYITAHNISPRQSYLGSSHRINATLTDDNDDLLFVNFTLIAPDGTIEIDNENGTVSGDYWTSSLFTLNQPGQWNYSIYTQDAQGANASANGSINFLHITAELNETTTLPNSSIRVTGHVNDSQLVNVANLKLHIWIDGVSALGWWNDDWLARTEITVENTANENMNNFITLINLSTQSYISDGLMNSDCSDVRFTDSNSVLLAHSLNPDSCNTTNTQFWVWTNLTANNNNTVYLYHDNPSAILNTTYDRPDNDMLVYFHFDNASEYGESNSLAFDYSRNDKNGTVSGATTASTGRFGGSMYFRTTDTDVVQINDTDTLGILDEMTVSAWVYPTAQVDYGRIIGKAWSSNEAPWVIFAMGWSASPYKVGFSVVSGGTSAGATSTTTIPLNQWTFVTGRYNGTHVSIWVNGTQEANNTKTGDIDTNTQPVALGTNTVYDSQDFTGYMDEVRIYNRSLSDEEIVALYNMNSLNYVENETRLMTNSSGNYAYDITAPSSEDSYDIVVNATNDDGEYGRSNQTLIVQGENNPPTVPTLLLPEDNNYTVFERYPTFNWTQSTDPESDPITYQWNITSPAGCAAIPIKNTSTTYYESVDKLCTDEVYNWTVRACDDSNECSEWATQFNFTIASVVGVTFTTAETAFGTLQTSTPTQNVTNDTIDNNPTPLIYNNSGNVDIITTIRADQALWSTQPLNTTYWQYDDQDSSDWNNITNTYTNLLANLTIATLREIEIRIWVPQGETPGSKTGTIRVLGASNE